MKIEGKRIYLREYKETDFKAFYKLVSDPLIRKLSLLKTPQTQEMALEEFNNITANQNDRNRTRFILGAFLKKDNMYFGDVGFQILKQNQTGGIAEIGYFLEKSFWGKGYATEIASLLIKYCFSELNIHKVIACCDKRNKASENVMIKCGMKKEGEFQKNRCKDNEWFDELKYGILKTDWVSMQTSAS